MNKKAASATCPTPGRTIDPTPWRILILLTAVLTATDASFVRAEESSVDPRLRERSASTIRRVFDKEQRWVKVHAAEYLLALDYSEGVKEAFIEELKSHGSEPQYRIGVWRVLAQAAGDECKQAEWIDKIRDVCFNPVASDRLHATETLAKLRYRLRDDEAAMMEQDAQREDEIALYAAWVLMNSNHPGAEDRLIALLQSPDANMRSSAAYALRHQPSISAASQENLLTSVRHEPRKTRAYAFLVAAAAVHVTLADSAEFKAKLTDLAVKGTEEERVEACQTLAQLGDSTDLPLLTGLLDDPSSDIRATAANAILRIGRRTPHHLGSLDWCIIGAYALGMLSIGWYYSRRTKTQEQYLLGDRQMKPLMVGVSLFASLFSCISYLAWPGEIIKYGPMILTGILAYPFIGLIIGWLIIPFIMKLKVTSAYEILELRFDPTVRTLGSVLFLSLRLLWMSVIVYAMASKVLVPLTGLDPRLTPAVCAILAFVTIIYTAMGGLRAVVITDVIQAAILFGAAFVTVVTVTVCLGGVQAWWPTHWPSHWPPLKLGCDINDRIPFLVLFISNITWYVGTSASDQIAIQRYLSTKDAKAARSVLLVSLVADACVSLILACVGLSLLAYYQAFPHLLPDGQTMLADGDKLFPQFIIIGLPVGLSGLVVAGLLACAMSALSAGINSTCSVLTVDILDRLRGKRREVDVGAERIGQLKHVSIVIGVVVVLLSMFVNMVQGNLMEICTKVVNLLTVPLAGLFLLAMFVPWARVFGVWVGVVCGLAVAIIISFWKEITGMQGISFFAAIPATLLVEVGIGALASLIPIGKVKPMKEIL